MVSNVRFCYRVYCGCCFNRVSARLLADPFYLFRCCRCDRRYCQTPTPIATRPTFFTQAYSTNAHKDGHAALECEDAIRKDYGRDLCQQSYRVEIDLVHGLSTSRPSAERDTQGRSLPVGSSAGSSFLIHGSENSRPSCRQRRTVLTFVQHFSNSRSTSARRL